jgi:hypothetical protein
MVTCFVAEEPVGELAEIAAESSLVADILFGGGANAAHAAPTVVAAIVAATSPALLWLFVVMTCRSPEHNPTSEPEVGRKKSDI